jgi:type IV pilus assembly protein PilV
MCRPPSPTPTQRRQAVRGFAIIEALIALLIFSIGALGLVGLQASMTRATGSAKHRADAAFLASDLIGTIWTDAANLASYDEAACDGHTLCKNWKDKVAATLPGGDATLSVTDSSGLVSIKITWTLPNEGAHNYVTAAAVNANP